MSTQDIESKESTDPVFAAGMKKRRAFSKVLRESSSKLIRAKGEAVDAKILALEAEDSALDKKDEDLNSGKIRALSDETLGLLGSLINTHVLPRVRDRMSVKDFVLGKVHRILLLDLMYLGDATILNERLRTKAGTEGLALPLSFLTEEKFMEDHKAGFEQHSKEFQERVLAFCKDKTAYATVVMARASGSIMFVTSERDVVTIDPIRSR